MPWVNQMNESRSTATGSRERCTTKAIPPRWSSSELLRRPTFPPRETTTTESSTSEAFVSPLRNESQSDTRYYPSSTPYSPEAEGSNDPLWEVPIHLEPATYRTESVGSSRTSSTSNRTHSRPLSWEERSPNAPLGWVGKRALKYQVRLSLQD